MPRNTLKGKRWLLALAALAVAPMAIAACGGDDDDDDATPAATTAAATTAAATGTTAAATSTTAAATPAVAKIDYTKLSGDVKSDGSSTVFPISEAVAEEFSKAAKNVKANVAFSGTGGGFEKFCRGEIDVSNASRPINQKEKDACAAANINDIVELSVAVDALTVAVSPQNTWAKCITPEQLQMLFKNGGVKKWNEVDPSWPADDIKFYYPGTDSGTFDYFREAIIDGYGGKAATPPLKHRGDGTSSEDDNILLRAVEGDKNAIAYFGFAYFQNEGKKLKALEINDKGKGCVGPSVDTALKGTYTPLSRPLFIYTRESLLKEKAQVLGFVKFFLDNAKKLVPEVGYVNVADDKAKVEAAKVDKYIK
ncbi:MAG: PstS family phosphate ABC transporter substrate-binding protein [Dehalococcoidia bacterium]